jgi:hypothetical protein
MKGHEIQAGDNSMMNVDRPVPSRASISSAAASVGAGVLILVGIVFQSCELGYAHLASDSHWIVSLLLESLWGALDGWLKSAGSGDAFRFWPLALVLAGCAILLSRSRD